MGKTLFASVTVLVLGMLAEPGLAAYLFTDQTPAAPLISGDYQRYVSLVGDGTNLGLWYENRTTGGIEMRTSASGYTGFGSPTATSGLTGLNHPRIYSAAGGGYVGFFMDATQSPPNGINRLTSTDGVTWGSADQVLITGSPGGSNIWGVVSYFENLSGITDVLYYTQGVGGSEYVFRATATDGLNFTHQGTAFVNPGSVGLYGAGISAGSQVLYDSLAGQYLLIWSGESIVANIGYATSSDGLSFTNQGTVVAKGVTHDDLQEASFVVNGASIVGVYTADYWPGSSNNHIGAFTGTPEPATISLLALGGLALLWRRRR